ncbi:MAG TPA: hypothetical protein VFD82_15745 [Planctomycetota bacterium]|nr:hypothetical protein [Planctomycetota bacterium]
MLARLATLSVLLLGACDSKVTSSAVDPDLLKRLETVQDCFPTLYPKAQALLDLAETWRLDSGEVIPDPAGLTWTVQTDGSTISTIVATLVSGDCTLEMLIRFYSPTGVAQGLDLFGATSLADAIDRAATQLAVLYPNVDKFMVGDWILSGPGISGTGALTGIIGGSTNQNELEELRTTTATPVGGPPPNADSMVIDVGPPECSLTFNTTSLQTDTDPTQQYPIGVINVTIVGPEATVTATITFDDTVIARIAVTDVPGRFDFNLETQSLTYVP